MNPAPAHFVGDLQDAKKNIFFQMFCLLPSKRVISSPFLHFSIFFSKILLGNPKFFAVGN
jgi:hypothetical protein